MTEFSSKKEGTWFYFDDTDESLGGIQLRLLTPVEEDKIERLTVKKKQKPYRGMQIETKTIDEKMKNRLTYDAWISDWNNVQLDGKEVSCNVENKLKMMEITDFARFVIDGILSLSETNETIEKAKVKNLKNTSGGKKQNQLAKDA
ncbi:hypothetical protein LCGC14_0834070 [marine sediment metagenome]|uniref:Uncharacterized protein n=1 Tax=marine sediment metagenome TaxID=412755 RepID=A0A0F9SMH1_9ZZZZ